MAVDGGVHADGEEVLVVLGEGAWGDDVAVRRRLALVDVDNRDDSRGSGFNGNGARLVEFVGEDVLVIGEGDDELHDELARTGHDCSAGVEVGVLPADASVLLV